MRVESALFNDVMVQCLEKLGVEYTISAPFERLVVLKERIEKRTLWLAGVGIGRRKSIL